MTLNAGNTFFDFMKDLGARFDLFQVLLSIVDILVLSLLLYICVIFCLGIMKKRSGKLLLGIFAFLLVVVAAYLFNLSATFFILEKVMQFGMIALVVIFQPELRSLLENLGNAGQKFRIKNVFVTKNEQETAITEICDAVDSMSKKKIGALIVFGDQLNPYDEMKAVNINADISNELVQNIFFKNSPLHDGAILVSNFRISMARVLFDEISNNPDLALDLGSRHKAAVGATEHESGCVAVVVSEETGKISFAHEGELDEGLTAEELRKILVKRLVKENEDRGEKSASKKKTKKTRR
ncbi:MAG: diadenylate cyclase [Clostridia bacterium]|nr:diadenylate cyclase [Clostridia bacterium]